MAGERKKPRMLLRQWADGLTAEMEAGTLTVASLRRALDEVIGWAEQRRQDLLYLQAYSSSPDSQVIGMTLIQDGCIVPVELDATQWPYQRVLDAVMDGWRIISFPNMALMAVPADEPHGLGFEFILERWS